MATIPCTGYKLPHAACNDYTVAPVEDFAVMNAAISSAPPQLTPTPLAGLSPVMLEVFRLIERVGPTEASVLLTGESGSGKECGEKAIYDKRSRRNVPFIAITC